MKLLSKKTKQDANAKQPDELDKLGLTQQAVQLDGQVGLGIDLVSIERMEQILSRTKSFSAKVFSEEERAYCDATANPATHYATRFAAKEAVLKALGTGFGLGIHPRDVEVVRHQNGRPTVRLSGRAQEVANKLQVVDLPISLSYTHTDAVACAMAITQESMSAQMKRVDPMEELSTKFKELRGMLDTIDSKTTNSSGA